LVFSPERKNEAQQKASSSNNDREKAEFESSFSMDLVTAVTNRRVNVPVVIMRMLVSIVVMAMMVIFHLMACGMESIHWSEF